MVAAGTLVERDRGRFRFTQRDACFRIQPRPPPFDGSSDSPSLSDLGHYTTATSTLNHNVRRIFKKSFEGDGSGEKGSSSSREGRCREREGRRAGEGEEEKEYKDSTASRGSDTEGEEGKTFKLST